MRALRNGRFPAHKMYKQKSVKNRNSNEVRVDEYEKFERRRTAMAAFPLK